MRSLLLVDVTAIQAVTAIAESVDGSSARFRWADVIRGDPIGTRINICRLLGFRVFI